VVGYEYVTRREPNLDKWINIKKLIGKRVLSKGGTIVGYISEIRINSNTLELEGIVIKKNFKKPIYIGKSYFSHLSNRAVILNMEPSILFVGKKVITIDGRIIGKVKKVNRKGTTNEVESFVVTSVWRKYLIPISGVRRVTNLVLIKNKYDARKIHLWKRSKQNRNV